MYVITILLLAPVFVRFEFNMVIFITIAIILPKSKSLGHLINLLAAVFLVYTTWSKQSNSVDVCTADEEEVNSFLVSCLAGWLASLVLDIKTSLLILGIPDSPQKRKYRSSQRAIFAGVSALVLNAFSVMAVYMHSDYQSFKLLTGDPWMRVYFGAATVGRIFSAGLQGKHC